MVEPSRHGSACSAGPLSRSGFERLAGELLEAIADAMSPDVAGVCLTLHGAMGAVGELDPEGYLLEGTRACVGPRMLIVISLDLHGIWTGRMLSHCDAIAVLWCKRRSLVVPCPAAEPLDRFLMPLRYVSAGGQESRSSTVVSAQQGLYKQYGTTPLLRSNLTGFTG